jgi:hypothetical protein
LYYPKNTILKELGVLVFILNLGYVAFAQNGSIIEVQGVASIATSPRFNINNRTTNFFIIVFFG